MPRMTKEERREKKLDKIRAYDEKMKPKRIARQEKQKAKEVRKADRKVKRIEKRLGNVSERSEKADKSYQAQLDREKAKDVEKGRTRRRTTILRRKRAKTAQKVASTVLAGLAAKNFAGLSKAKKIYTAKQALKKQILPVAKVAGQISASAATAREGVPEDAPTIFEPRLLRKALLRKKKARIEKKLDKAKKKREKEKSSKGIYRYDN